MTKYIIKLSIVIGLVMITRIGRGAGDGILCEDRETGQSYSCSISCTSDSTWIAVTSGFEKKATRELNCQLCKCILVSIQYRCATGYYGTADSTGMSGCTKCPCLTDVDGFERCGMNAADSKYITTCSMSSTYTFNDGTGNYKFTSDCAYSD
ncbi:MAG: hypothetical protein LBF37_00840 [Rickettsiales bacterium]|jgi:hypothetical protein|nr:hypothetical protein [Rickettsiales bacterium]